MLTLERYDDVTRVRMTSWRGRLAGYEVSAYLVRGLLVDTGFPRAARDLAGFLDAHRVAGVIVTHCHEDHAGNVGLVASRGLPMSLAAATAARLSDGAGPPIRFYRRFVWGATPRLHAHVAPFATDALRVIGAPGHTADHRVVWDPERATLFSGDLFLGVRVRAAFPDEDPRQLLATLRQVAALSPRRMFDAHRGLIPNPSAALAAKGDWLEETIARIEDKLRAGWTDREVTRHVLGRESAVGLISGGEYSKLTFVEGVRRGLPAEGGEQK